MSNDPQIRAHDTSTSAMTAKPNLVLNVLWSLLGAGLPLLVGLVAIPPLLHGLGTDRFGILALGWVLVGYLSLFDLGLGRALTQLVAERLGARDTRSIPELIGTAVVLVSVFGGIGAVIVWLCTPWLVNYVLRIPPDLYSEARAAFYLLAVSLPFVVSGTAFRAVLEAYQRFAVVNVVRGFLGISTLLGPLLVLPLSNNLALAVSTIVLARIITTIALYWLCRDTVQEWRGYKFASVHVRSLARFGSWMTVSNIVGPLMVYMDRFLIGTLISVTAVAYYAIPYEMVTKLWVIPGALVGVLFPALASSLRGDRERARVLYRRGITYNYLMLFPIVLTVVTFAKEGLNAWLGQEFAYHGTAVLQLLAVGVLINSLANLPFALIQANGRPDITAKIHVIELPFYLGALWVSVQYLGIIGAALVWTGRVLVDAVVLFFVARRVFDGRWGDARLWTTLIAVSAIALAALPILPGAIKTPVFGISIVGFFATAWWIVLAKDIRVFMARRLTVQVQNKNER